MTSINSLIGCMVANDRIMTECLKKVLKILAKNEMKFIYGKLIEKNNSRPSK